MSFLDSPHSYTRATRQLPHGWTIEDKKRADLMDSVLAHLAICGLVVIVLLSVVEYVSGGVLPSLAVITANK